MSVAQDHPGAIAYRRTADAFRAGGLGLVRTLIAPEAVWHVPGEHHLAGTIEGREALLAFLAKLGKLGFWFVEHDVFASDQHVCAISTMSARRSGVDAETRVVSMFRYRGAQQVERWVCPTTTTPGTRSSERDRRRGHELRACPVLLDDARPSER